MDDFFSSLYVHIPFCIRKCKYCDFYSLTHDASLEAIFVESLLREIEFTANIPHVVETIYVGGGTPNCLSFRALERIFEVLMKTYRRAENFEFTVELNPGLSNHDFFSLLRDFEVNRLSIGVQSFVDSELNILGRAHRSKEVFETVALAKKLGFKNLSIDLIYGIPSQSIDSFLYSLNLSLSLDINHISLYELTYPEGTALSMEISRGSLRPLSDDLIHGMYTIGSNFLEERGFRKYEISNFSRINHRCRHNLAYWMRKPYLGLGPSAHSFIGERRFHNTSELRQYCEEVGVRGVAWKLDKILDEHDKVIESLILGLRLTEGIDIRGYCLETFFEPYVFHGFVEIERGRLRLTDKGMLLSNEIFVRVISHIENCHLCKEELGGLFLQTERVFG